MTESLSEITPVLTVRRASQAIAFYERALGAEEVYRNTYPDGRIVAEMTIGTARFRVADEAPEMSNLSPKRSTAPRSGSTCWLTTPDGHAARAVANGAVEIAPMADQPYGLRQCRFADPFGHHWLIGCPLPGAAGDWARRG